MDYETINIKDAALVYCAFCKKDPKTEPTKMCNECLLREIWTAEYAEPQEEH